jgi:hypothetical protein
MPGFFFGRNAPGLRLQAFLIFAVRFLTAFHLSSESRTDLYPQLRAFAPEGTESLLAGASAVHLLLIYLFNSLRKPSDKFDFIKR